MSKPRYSKSHLLFMILFFVCLGITTEVFFTAFAALFANEPFCGKPLASMTGHTYVWMAFIYALIPVLGVLFHHRFAHLPLYARLSIYVILLYGVEFISGYLLQLTTGKCPWQYTAGWHIMGLIRLDFLPAWTIFCWSVERLYVFIDTRVIR